MDQLVPPRIQTGLKFFTNFSMSNFLAGSPKT